MNTQISTQTITFYNAELITLKVEGIIYTAVKPIVEALGLSWGTQQRKLENSKGKFSCTHMKTTGSDGKTYEMLCIPIRKLNGWLFSINPEKVRPDLKDRVIKYQEECFEALYNYWFKGKAERALPLIESDTITPEEQRMIQNAVAATHQRTKMSYGEIWARVKNKFAVAKYEQIKRSEHHSAMIYIASMRPVELPQNSIVLDEDFYMLAKAMNYINHSISAWERLEDLFSDLESHKNYKTAFNLGTASNDLAQTLERFVIKHTPSIKNANIRQEIESWIFNSPRAEQHHTKNVNYLR